MRCSESLYNVNAERGILTWHHPAFGMSYDNMVVELKPTQMSISLPEQGSRDVRGLWPHRAKDMCMRVTTLQTTEGQP